MAPTKEGREVAMIDILAEIEKDNSDFINIYDFIDRVKAQVNGCLQDVCIWIVKEITKKIPSPNIPEISPIDVYKIDEFHRVTMHYDPYCDDLSFIERKLKLVINNNVLPIHSSEDSDIPFDWVDNDFFTFGFSVKGLKLVFPDINLDKTQARPSGWGAVDLTSSDINTSADIDTPAERAPDIEWEKKFAGRAAALEIIGAISKVLVEKSGSKYLHGENISANAIADSVADMTDKSPGNYRKLISEALKISGLAKD